MNNQNWKRILPAKFSFLILLIFLSGCTSKALLLKKFQPANTLNLPVTELRDNFIPYQDFCLRNPGECDLSGQTIIERTPSIWKQLLNINKTVNRDIALSFDKDQYQKEEFWTYPSSGFGDCEDMALEKRYQLVKIGFPRGSLRLAIGHHERTLISHAVLTVETKQGTYVLDSINDQIHIWHQTPYNFETRERTDGKWDRYDQDIWEFD